MKGNTPSRRRLNGQVPARRLTKAEQLAELQAAVRKLVSGPDGKMFPVNTYPSDAVLELRLYAGEVQEVVRLLRRDGR